MKVKFDSSVKNYKLSVNSRNNPKFKASSDKVKRKGLLARAGEAAMTIIGGLMPDHWGSMWQWQSGPGGDFWSSGPRTRNSYSRGASSCTACASPGREIQIPIQITGRPHYPASTSSSYWDEFSDFDSDDDLNNSSSARCKRRRNRTEVKITPSEESLLNEAVSNTYDDKEEDLKRKQYNASASTSRQETVRTIPITVTRAKSSVTIPPTCDRTIPQTDARSSHAVLIRSDSEEQDINDTCNYSVYEYLKTVLASTGRQIDSMKGDGNCFFRALSKVIYGSQNYYDDVRQAVVDVLEKYPKTFEAFTDGPIQQHIRDMREDKTWATQTEIYAAATLLNRDIYILSPHSSGDTYRWLLFQPQARYNKSYTGCKCYVTICHTHGNHYDRIAPIDGKCNCGLPAPDLTGVKGNVDLTMEDEVV